MVAREIVERPEGAFALDTPHGFAGRSAARSPVSFSGVELLIIWGFFFLLGVVNLVRWRKNTRTGRILGLLVVLTTGPAILAVAWALTHGA